MNPERARLLAELAQTVEQLAAERQYVGSLSAHLDKVRSAGWAEGAARAQAVIEARQTQIANLERQRDELVMAIGKTIG